jgi:hypothetical protein
MVSHGIMLYFSKEMLDEEEDPVSTATMQRKEPQVASESGDSNDQVHDLCFVTKFELIWIHSPLAHSKF